jgi:hypothetical protein
MGRVKMHRKYLELVIVRINYNLGGVTSWTFRPIPGLVSWNSRTRRWRVGLPGPFYWESQPTGGPR